VINKVTFSESTNYNLVTLMPLYLLCFFIFITIRSTIFQLVFLQLSKNNNLFWQKIQHEWSFLLINMLLIEHRNKADGQFMNTFWSIGWDRLFFRY